MLSRSQTLPEAPYVHLEWELFQQAGAAAVAAVAVVSLELAQLAEQPVEKLVESLCLAVAAGDTAGPCHKAIWTLAG